MACCHPSITSSLLTLSLPPLPTPSPSPFSTSPLPPSRSTQVAHSKGPKGPQEATIIRYTPSQQGAQYNSGAKQRIIAVREVQRDLLEPPRFKTNKKLPGGPPSPPAPVLHSPPRKVSAEEQKDWQIPPCIRFEEGARERRGGEKHTQEGKQYNTRGCRLQWLP